MFDLILDSVKDFHTVEERRLHRIFGGLHDTFLTAALYGSQSNPYRAAFLFLHIQSQMPFNSPLNFLLLDTDIPVRNGGGAMLLASARKTTGGSTEIAN